VWARFLKNFGGTMTAKEVYLHLADVCEHAAATVLLPETKLGMLASAAAWRRLAAACRPAEKSGLNALQDGLAVKEDLEARSVSALSIQVSSSSKN
jgi:hypothetical protein